MAWGCLYALTRQGSAVRVRQRPRPVTTGREAERPRPVGLACTSRFLPEPFNISHPLRPPLRPPAPSEVFLRPPCALRRAPSFGRPSMEVDLHECYL